MRFATASTLATFAFLVPLKLHALEIPPGAAKTSRAGSRVMAQAPAAPLLRTSASAPGDPAKADAKDNGRRAATPASEICASLVSAAVANELPVVFFLRLIWHESRFDPFAVSRAGALGIAQFMPRVAKALGLADPFDPAEALAASARFLRMLHTRFGNLGLAAAAYNAGARRIQDWLERRKKLPQQTRDYVRKITGLAPKHWVKAAPNDVALEVPPEAPCRIPDPPSTRTADAWPSPPRPGDSPADGLRSAASELLAISKAHPDFAAGPRRAAPPASGAAAPLSVASAKPEAGSEARPGIRGLGLSAPTSDDTARLVHAAQATPGPKMCVQPAKPPRSAAADLCARLSPEGRSCPLFSG